MVEHKSSEKNKHNIRLKYRISFINEDSFDEVRRVRLSVFNILLFIVGTLVIATAIVVSLIFYTPLREYVPGYPDSQTERVMINNKERVDSVLHKLEQQELYLEGIRKILQGDIPEELYADTSAEHNKGLIIERARLEASEEEISFRSEIESEEQYNLGLLDKVSEEKKGNIFFYTPVKGMITNHFNTQEKHYGVDLATASKEHILAIADGTVILVDYSMTSGHVVSIQHADNLISTYRHASVVFKAVGDKVKAGEVIALVGNTGTLSTGVHLHLEMWQGGEAIDPETLIVF